MAIIKLQRPSELLNLLRKYQIYIDGINIGTISNGETKEFSISEGQHIIIAKIGWCSSQEINFYIEETQTEEFYVEGFRKRKWIIPIGLGIVALGFILFSIYNVELSKFFTPVIGYLFYYYIKVERKKYLSLSEDIEQK